MSKVYRYGELYTPVVEVTKCDLCKGKGFVTEATADGYDPFEIIEGDDY
jgi:hypothetical protein